MTDKMIVALAIAKCKNDSNLGKEGTLAKQERYKKAISYLFSRGGRR